MIRRPYLIFIGDTTEPGAAKTGFGLRDWAADQVIGQWRLPGCGFDLGVPELTAGQAAARGAGSLLIGVAVVGGQLPPHWIDCLLTALHAGLDVVSGLHTRLNDIPLLRDAAAGLGRTLHDVRHTNRRFPVGTGRKRGGRRALMVGTDCAVGKKYSALCIARALTARGIDADFRATGQTGIMISGAGIAVDAVVADFVAGAAETLSPDAAADHWDVIEGQGSLLHPGYAAVTLGLLHGSQPDVLVLCHESGRAHIAMMPDFPIPPLPHVADLYLRLARLTNPGVRCAGICLNTATLADDAARAVLAQASAETGLPATDPIRYGVETLVDALVAAA